MKMIIFAVNKMICQVFDCKCKIALVVGKCKFCNESHCMSHRLPESHQCKNIEECKEKARDYLKEKLTSEQILIDKLRF